MTNSAQDSMDVWLDLAGRLVTLCFRYTTAFMAGYLVAKAGS